MSDFNLELAIRSAFDASGIKASESAIESFTVHVNAAASSAKATASEQNKLSREFGGSRGPVADLTRILLENVGATHQSGEVAKFAGAAVRGLGAAASGLTVGAAGLVAIMSFVIPKLIDWFEKTQDVKEETDLLNGSVSSELDFLEEYAHKVGTLNGALLTRLSRLRDVAFEEQKLKVQSNIGEIEKLEGLTKKLNEANARRFTVTGNYIEEDKKASKEAHELGIQVEAAASKIAALKAENVELNQAIKDGVILERLRREEIKFADGETARLTKTEEARRREEERLNKLHEENLRVAAKLRAERGKEEVEQRKQHAEDIKRATEFILSNERQKASVKQEAEAAIRARREMNAEMIAISAEALATAANAFTKNKGINIAAAIADTYAAAVKAYNISGGGVWGIPMMALTIAQGLAQVQQIRKSNPGFDDPTNDMIARGFGAKWASDLMEQINMGFMRNLQAIGSGSTYQYHINRGTTVNASVSGFIGSSTELEKRLVRMITHANRGERRTTS